MGGATWTVQHSDIGPRLVSCPSATTCYAVADEVDVEPQNAVENFDYGTLQTTDGGATWYSVPGILARNDYTNGTFDNVEALDCAAATTCAALVTTNNHQTSTETLSLRFSSDGASSWQSISLPLQVVAQQAMSCPMASTCFVAGPDPAAGNAPSVATVNLSTGAVTVHDLSWPAGSTLGAISCSAAASCVVAGEYVNGTTAVTELASSTADGGMSWTSPVSTPSIEAKALACVTSTCVLAGVVVGNGSKATPLAHSTDGGATWVADPTPAPTEPAPAIACPTSTYCITAYTDPTESPAYGGTLVTTDGTTWSPAAPIPIDGSGRPWSPNPYAAPFCTADGGTCVVPGRYEDGQGDRFPGDMYTTDAGATWHSVSEPAGFSLGPFTDDGNGDTSSCPTATTCFALATGSNGVGVLRSSDGGHSFVDVSQGLNVQGSLACASATTCMIYSTYGGGPNVVTTDAGASWQQISVAKDQNSSTVGASALSCLPTASGTTCRLTGTYGGVYTSTDLGQSWTAVSPSANLFGITCVSASDCWAIESDRGAIARSTDGGADWTDAPIASPYRNLSMQQVACASATACWATSVNGGIYATTNGGQDAPPSAVQGLSFTGDGHGNATVSWQPPTDPGNESVDFYAVSASANDHALTRTVNVPAGATSIPLNGLDGDTQWTVSVQAATSVGLSPASSATLTQAGVPSEVQNEGLTPGRTTIDVSWSAPAASGGSPITGYQLTANPGGHTATVASDATSYSLTGLTPLTTYTVTVAAVNGNGSGPSSVRETTTAQYASPGAPIITGATPSNSAITVTWTPPTDDGGSPLTSYTVVATTNGQTTSVDAPNSSRSATVAGLQNGDAYTISVYASNTVGAGDAAHWPTPVVPGAPGAPTAVNATADDGRATVSWTPPSSNGGSAITGYTVTSAPDGITKSVDGSTTTATLTGLTDGTGYTFTVTATNATGTGPSSAPSNAVTPRDTTPPTVRITSTPPNPAPATSASFSFTGTDNSSPQVTFTCSLDGDAATACPSPTTYSDLTNGSHTFTVTGRDQAGNTSTPVSYSWQVDTVAPTAALTGPTKVATLASSTTVSWAGSDASGSGIAHYQVRYTHAAYNAGFGKWVYPSSWQSLTTTSLTQTGLQQGYDYCWSVRAVDQAGNTSAWSADKCTAMALDDRSMTTGTSGWTRARGSAWWNGTATTTTTKDATLTRTGAQLGQVGIRRDQVRVLRDSRCLRRRHAPGQDQPLCACQGPTSTSSCCPERRTRPPR